MNVEKSILLVKDHNAIYSGSCCEHQNRDYIASIWLRIAQETGRGKWNAPVFCCLVFYYYYYYYYYYDDDKNNSNTNNSNNVVLTVIRPYISSFYALFFV